MSKARVWWARPKCDESRPFDTGYCSADRPSLGGGNSSDETLVRRGFVKVIEYSAVEKLVKALEHPDIEELACDCGDYGDTEPAHHTCIKCFARDALKEFRGEG